MICVVNEDLLDEAHDLGLTDDEAWALMRTYSDRQLMSDNLPLDLPARCREIMAAR